MYGTCMLEKINTETFRTILHEIRTKKPSIFGASLLLYAWCVPVGGPRAHVYVCFSALSKPKRSSIGKKNIEEGRARKSHDGQEKMWFQSLHCLMEISKS